jgi:hypothetical protein
VNLSSNGTFADTIGLGCASLPVGVFCHFSSPSVKLAADGSASVQLTIDTNNPLSGGSSAMNSSPINSPQVTSKFSLAGLFLPVSVLFGFVFWCLRRRNARILTMSLILLLSAAALVATGCDSYSVNTATPGNYVIQVTGTGASTNAQQYQDVSLTITK